MENKIMQAMMETEIQFNTVAEQYKQAKEELKTKEAEALELQQTLMALKVKYNTLTELITPEEDSPEETIEE